MLRLALSSTDRQFLRLAQQYDEDHSPDRQQRVPDCVRDGVTEPRNLTFGDVIDHAERGRRRARAGATSQHKRVIETEKVLSDVHCQDQRQRRNEDAP